MTLTSRASVAETRGQPERGGRQEIAERTYRRPRIRLRPSFEQGHRRRRMALRRGHCPGRKPSFCRLLSAKACAPIRKRHTFVKVPYKIRFSMGNAKAV
jgi:hypothetical protein